MYIEFTRWEGWDDFLWEGWVGSSREKRPRAFLVYHESTSKRDGKLYFAKQISNLSRLWADFELDFTRLRGRGLSAARGISISSDNEPKWGGNVPSPRS